MKNKIVYPAVIALIVSIACVIIECAFIFSTYTTNISLAINHNDSQWITFFLAFNPSLVGSIKFLMDPIGSAPELIILVHSFIIIFSSILLLRGKLKKTGKTIMSGIFIVSCIISVISVILYCSTIQGYFFPGGIPVYPNIVAQFFQFAWLYLLGAFVGLAVKIWIIIVTLRGRDTIIAKHVKM